jgi:hemerythrin-like domain-containing protein
VSDTPTPAPRDDSPISEFSNCHVGILGHLSALGELPALLEPAARARQVAAETLKFFRDVVYEHHQQEERELFPAVLASAVPGEERDRVQAIVERLTREHRAVEAAWSRLEPALKDVARGHDSNVRGEDIAELVRTYEAHARDEEQQFLPLSQAILGRNSDHMAALGLSLHMRHSLPDVLARYGGRIRGLGTDAEPPPRRHRNRARGRAQLVGLVPCRCGAQTAAAGR